MSGLFDLYSSNEGWDGIHVLEVQETSMSLTSSYQVYLDSGHPVLIQLELSFRCNQP